MSDGPRYATLRDYLDVFRRQRLLILAVAALFCAAAFAYAQNREPVYTSAASLAIRDVSRDFDLVATPALPTREAPETLAISSAERATRPEIAARVKRALRSRLTVDELRGMVSARAEARTAFVVFETRAASARFSARLANEFAKQFTVVTTREQRARYARAADSLRAEFEKKRRSSRRRSPLQRQLFEERVSRVAALEDFAQPVETARRAEVPTSPTSPRPVRDTLLGLILGLTVAIVLAFARDGLDRRMKGPHEIQEELGVPLLGYVSNKALGGGLASPGGQGAIPDADLEAFRILRANLDFLEVDKPPRSFMVTSALPEEGKTTVAIALAGVYAAAGRRTVLIECDLRRPVFSKRLGFPTTPGLSDYLAGRASEEAITREVVLPWTVGPAGPTNGTGPDPVGTADQRHTVTLPCVSAGTVAPHSADLLTTDRFKSLLERMTKAYDVVILDSAPLLPVVDTLELVPLVDAILLCVRPSRTTRDQAAAAKAALDHFPARPIGLVTTGMRQGDAANYGYYGYDYGYRS